MTESVVEQSVHCTESTESVEPQRQKWRSPRQGRQSDKRGRDRVSQRLRDWADLETRKWRVSLTQHWLLTHKASTTGRLSVTGQVLLSRLLFIVECLLLSTVLFASLSLSRLFDRVAQTCNHWPWVPWGELKGSPRRPRFASTLSLLNLHNAVTHTPRAPNTLLYFAYIYLCILYITLFIIYKDCNGTWTEGINPDASHTVGLQRSLLSSCCF